MKILTFGSCHLTMLFEESINKTFLDSIHHLNYGCYGACNIISLSHDIAQTIFILNLIKNKRIIVSTDNDYELIKKLSVFIQNNGDYRENLLSINPNYDINESIINIHNQLNEVRYIILEVCTLKQLIINGVPLFLDINNQSDFGKITDEEFLNNMDNLVNLVNSINENIKIIFVSHFISYKGETIQERLYILELLRNNINKYNNCYVMCPNDYIIDEDLEDNRHYKIEGRYKMLNAIENKILDIESTNIVNIMNHKGIMSFNIKQYLNNEELDSYNNLNEILDKMIDRIKNNENYKNFSDDNKYIYSINNYLDEPFNLNNKIFIDFFKIALNNLITKIAEKYLENNVYIYNPALNVNYNCSDNRVESQNWHRDPGGRKLIKFFLFFDDIGELNGSFEYIPNTQYTSLSKISDLYDFNTDQSIYPINFQNDTNTYNKFIELSNNNNIITTSSKYGCISVDTSGFHRAGFCYEGYYRKYIHILFLTKYDVINNKDPCDKYQNGFNYNKVWNIDINLIDNILNKKVSQFFYR